MQQLKKLKFIFLLYFMFCNLAFASNDPVTLLQSVADNMIAGLKANQATLKTKPQIVYNLAHRYVVPHADLPMMSKSVLPPAIWNHASNKEREAFIKQFTQTLIRTYASALTAYRDQQIKFFPIRDNSRSIVTVNGEITGSNMNAIRVSYRLIQSSGAWKLYDMSVEGVSMLESFRSQFADILSQGSMSQLLSRMQAHNSR